MSAVPEPAARLSPEREAEIAAAVAVYEGHPGIVFACCSAHAPADGTRELLAELAAVRAERNQARERVAELEAERHTTNEALSDAAEHLRRDRDRIAELEADLGEAAVTSEALNRALHNEKLAGSALYAALTMPTAPEQRQAALDQFKAVARREEPVR